MASEELIGELMRLAAGLRRVSRRRLAGTVPGPRLPEAQRELLIVVEQRPGIGVSAAARHLHLAGNSVSTLVNTLVENGMLRRENDPADRRAARLTLTAAARARLDAWRTARAALLGAALDRADPADPAAIAAALPALRRLLAEVGESEGATSAGYGGTDGGAHGSGQGGTDAGGILDSAVGGRP
ncbi:MarR family winged helix-turn-helix transcriptional regulator [Rhizomonospora bruguierae]|uniref:MarR family winged helix-turn-helix transcriptional regulator n=1 Tax=Rhizomonospora bruguierae TaxID=1581705 RepID=UPI0020BD6B46|nr:helix-turn-helix domain-containing protein [Micromonospora sp. NBRC 107566]